MQRYRFAVVVFAIDPTPEPIVRPPLAAKVYPSAAVAPPVTPALMEPQPSVSSSAITTLLAALVCRSIEQIWKNCEATALAISTVVAVTMSTTKKLFATPEQGSS